MKKIILLGLTTMLCLSTFGNSTSAAIEPKVIIDNKIVESSKPIIKNSRTMVQFRSIFEELGMNVAWDPTTRQVIGEKRGLKIEMTIGKSEVFVTHSKPYYPEEYKAKYTLDQPAQILNGRTIVPLRFVAETSKATVNWDNVNKIASITTAPKFCPNPNVGQEQGSLEEYLLQNEFTMSQEQDRNLFYDNNISPETYMLSLDHHIDGKRLFIGMYDNERHLDLGAEIAVHNGFPATKDQLLQMLKSGKYVYDGTCNGVTYTYYINNGFNIILAWK